MEGFKERFAKKVSCGADHWLWTGYCTPLGYGLIGVAGGKLEYAHRAAWALKNGPIPDGMAILHTCDIPNCVRNDESGTYYANGSHHPRLGHLWLGTKADNSADMSQKERAAHTKLSNAAVLAIRSRYGGQRGEETALAREFGVSQATISDIVLVKSRRQV